MADFVDHEAEESDVDDSEDEQPKKRKIIDSSEEDGITIISLKCHNNYISFSYL